MRHLYELDTEQDKTSLDLPAYEYQSFWRYRVPITVEHLNISLNEFTTRKSKGICNILQEFLNQVCWVLILLNFLLNSLEDLNFWKKVFLIYVSVMIYISQNAVYFAYSNEKRVA